MFDARSHARTIRVILFCLRFFKCMAVHFEVVGGLIYLLDEV